MHYMTIWLGQHQPPPTSYKADAARAHYLPTCCRSPAPCSAHLARCIPQHQHSINITGIPQHCFHISHCLPVCSAKHMHTKLQDIITKIVSCLCLFCPYIQNRYLVEACLSPFYQLWFSAMSVGTDMIPCLSTVCVKWKSCKHKQCLGKASWSMTFET